MKDLDIKTKIKIFTLISFYELIIGFIIGIILNKFSKYIIPYSSSENIYLTILLTCLLGVIFITIVLYFRDKINYFPGIKKYHNNVNYKHPPPIALTLGFWVTQKELFKRKESVFNFINNL